MSISDRGSVPPVRKQFTDERQVLAGNDGLAGDRMAKVMQAQLAEVGVLAYSVPTGYEPVGVIDAGKAGEQKSVRVTATGQRVDDGAGSIAERHGARAGFRVLKIERVLSDVAPA